MYIRLGINKTIRYKLSLVTCHFMRLLIGLIAQNWFRVLQRIETWDEIEIQGNEVILQTLLNLYLIKYRCQTASQLWPKEKKYKGINNDLLNSTRNHTKSSSLSRDLRRGLGNYEMVRICSSFTYIYDSPTQKYTKTKLT
jgi:hypothetical protein